MEQLNDCLQLGCLRRSAVQADVRKRMSPPNRQDANANAVLTMAEQRDLEKLHQQDQKEIKALKQDLRRKGKALEGQAHGRWIINAAALA